ncbi:MAG TPA: ABC transporter substrate binding protein [Candidatus Acidoferrum sp.]|nr:ABC transporter substrate binding protein [Candidatus Acidoferrum sp.]
MISRIVLMVVLSLAIVAADLPADAQTPRVPTVGYLSVSTPAVATPNVDAFRQGLPELGYVEGKTVVLAARYGEARSERLPQLARELRGLKLDVIVTANNVATAAVKREMPAIPIVMAKSIDPVGTGFVASLARPGGNVTGLSNVSAEFSGKRRSRTRARLPATRGPIACRPCTGRRNTCRRAASCPTGPAPPR